MRWLLASLALLMVASTLPTASAQDVPALAEDDSGDVIITVGDQTQPAPADRYQQADLVKAWGVETPTGFDFTMQVSSLVPNPDAAFADNMQYFLQFRNKDRDFRMHAFRQVFTGPFYTAQIEARDNGRGPFYAVAEDVPIDVDDAAGTITISATREQLLDMSGSVPHPGQPFTGFTAYTRGSLVNENGISFGDGATAGKAPLPVVTDRMPDEGNGTGILDIKQGVSQLGLARLYSDVPTRSSNGENTTFVYTVQALNLGKSADTYDLLTDEVPAGWTVRLPASTVEIDGNASISFPVLVSTPFQHIHGEYLGFVVTMASQTDASSVGRIQLGIRYPFIPQPAGHHNKIFLYAQTAGASDVENQALCPAVFGGAGCSFAYMNAAENDPTDEEKLAVPAQSCSSFNVPHYYCWYIPLTPGLDLGLDFKTGELGKFDVNIAAPSPLIGASLFGGLYYQPIRDEFQGFPDEQGDLLLATVEATAPQDMTSASTKVFTTTVKPTGDSDYIAYQAGAGMYLMLTLTATTPDPGFGPVYHPTLEPGSIMELPLLEYHDKVNLTFSNTESLELTTLGSQDRVANPGTGVLFNVTLVNHGPAGRFRAELSGNHHDWSQALVPETFDVGSGSSVNVPVAVRIPAGARAGDVADLVLIVSNLADLNQRALAQLYVTVDVGGNHPDDTKAIDALAGNVNQKKSPGFEPAVAVVGLALLVAVIRRGKALK